ncbi:MAG: PTPA-CTERM sorting domain-containing protein [Stenomitos rutilans HA7619-LM2]|jgi:hypothetical protein|nr:PTPA-CTERM sorting domain-containing protein [Stenomitos rutilans HA7619-LM2]
MSQSTLLKQSLITAIGATCFLFTTENIKPVSAASFTAVDFSAPTTNFTNGSWSLGFQFTTKKAVNVTTLGFYDDFQNNLTQTHDVGIFDDTGNLLVQGTVKPGDSLDGYFRYTSVSSTLLKAGGTFFIAAVTGSESYTFNPTGFSVNPNITFVSSAFRFSNTLVFPGTISGTTPGSTTVQNSDNNLGYFGPNFQANEVAAVPTPALLPGLIGLGIGVLRKRKAEAAKQTNDL